MRFRKLALAVSLAGALGCEMASALGLGEIKLNSTLNQPLDAEIKLLRLRELGEGEILVNVASREDFQRAGVDRVFFLNDLKFEIKLENPSGPIIKVTTRKVVREPFLNFLLETQWPNGRILREYTLLMDLPVFGDESVRAVTPAAVSSPARPVAQQPAVVASVRERAPVAEPEREVEKAQTRRATPSAKRVEGGVYGPVGSNDTLWEIALKARPDRSHSVQQTMLAIQRLNPEAFINGNINLLRKGQVLRLPKASQISELNGRQAVNEVAFQNDQWSGDADGGVSGAQLDGSGRGSSASAPVSNKQGRLKLASGADAENVDAGRGAGEVGGDTEALQNELAITLDELDKTRRDNGELKSRIDELEMQIQTMERLVDVSSQELRALQLAGKSSAEALDTDAAPASAETEPATEDGVSDAVAADTMPAVKPVAQAPAAKVVDPSRVVISAPKKEASLLDTVFDNIALVAGGLVALLVAAVLVLRRRKEDDGADDELTTSMMDDEPLFVGDDETPEDEFEGDEVADSDELELDVESELEDFDLGELELDGFESEEASAVSSESQTGDAVGEADIYIAYGKYDQAEEMLLKALDAGGDSLGARMKLLEVYAETNDATKFDGQYSSVLATHDIAAHERAAGLRQQLSDAGEYDPGATGVEEPASLEGDELTLDEGLDFDLGDTDGSLVADELATGEEFDLDTGLDLDLDLGDTSGSASDTGEELSFDLDFDLDDDTADSGLVLEGADDDALLTLGSDDGDELTLDLELGDTHLQDEFSLEAELDASEEPSGFDLPELDDIASLGSEAELESEETLGDTLDELSVLTDEIEDDLEVGGAPELAMEEGITEPDFDLDFDLEADVPSLDISEEGEPSLAADLDLELDDAVDLGASLEVMPSSDEGRDDDSHFDLDLGDVDLASLDEEVDALSADLDMGDDDFAALVLEEPVEGSSVDELPGDLEAVDGFDAGLASDVDETLELDSLENDPVLDTFESEESGLEFEVSDLEDSALEVSESEALELEVSELDIPELGLSDLDVSDLESADLQAADLDLSEDLPVLDTELDQLSDPESFDASLDLSEEGSDDLSVEFAEFETTDFDVPAAEQGIDEGLTETVAEPEPEFDLAADLGLEDMPELPSTEEGMFDAALADLPEPEEALEDLPDLADEDDAELDFLADTDEAATKLDLARAYIDMGDQEGAKDILDEVVQEGSDEQRTEADELLARMS